MTTPPAPAVRPARRPSPATPQPAQPALPVEAEYVIGVGPALRWAYEITATQRYHALLSTNRRTLMIWPINGSPADVVRIVTGPDVCHVTARGSFVAMVEADLMAGGAQ